MSEIIWSDVIFQSILFITLILMIVLIVLSFRLIAKRTKQIERNEKKIDELSRQIKADD